MPPSSTPRALVYLIVGTLCSIAVIGMVTMALALFYKAYKADPVILAAFIPMVSGAIGSLGTLLANTRQPAATNGTSSTTTTTTIAAPIVTTNDPVPVQVVNQPQDPVPTTEEKKP